jgi:hypothetical protein
VVFVTNAFVGSGRVVFVTNLFDAGRRVRRSRRGRVACRWHKLLRGARPATAGRIGKPVQVRHGPAAVTGELPPTTCSREPLAVQAGKAGGEVTIRESEDRPRVVAPACAGA